MRLRVTKSIYQEAKFLLVFVPGVTEATFRETPLDTLMASQCASVVQASNDVLGELTIPFLAEGNWLPVNDWTGVFGLVLADPLITSNESGGKIVYTLECFSSMHDGLKFRYASLPRTVRLPDPSEPGGGGLEPPPSGTSSVGIGEAYAASSSRRARAAYDSNNGWGETDELTLVSSTSPCFLDARSCIPVEIPKSPEGQERLAAKLSALNLSPPFSFVSDTLVMYLTMVPFLPTTPRFDGTLPRASENSHNGRARAPWQTNLVVNSTAEGGDITWDSRTPEWEVLLPTRQLAETFLRLKWKVLMCSYLSVDTIICFEADKITGESWLHLKYKWKSDYDKQTPLGLKKDSPLRWFDSTESLAAWNKENEVTSAWKSFLSTAASRAPYPYFSLYTSAFADLADPIMTWINSSTSTAAPIEATGQTFALSASQSPRLFDMLPSSQESRGVFTWLFNVFNGNQQSAWAKVARVADMVVEFILPLILTFDGSPQVADVRQGWRVEFDSLTSDDSRALPALASIPVRPALTWLPAADTTMSTVDPGPVRRFVARRAEKRRQRSASRE